MADTPADLDDFGLLSGFAPKLANMFVSLAGDIALVVDQEGVVRNVAVREGVAGPTANTWVGRPWAETVTGDTRRKIELLLQEVGNAGVTRRREVNHPSSGGADIPMSYSALRLGAQGPVIAVGRDLRAVAAIQQQMLHAQQDMERDYWTLRREQSHQRELDQLATDAVLVVEAASLQVRVANAAASGLFADTAAPLPAALQDLLVAARHSGKAAELRTRLKSGAFDNPMLDLFITPLRASKPSDSLRLMVRARRVGFHEAPPPETATVVTDTRGRVLMANDALLAMCPVAAASTLQGQLLCEVLDGSQGALATLMERVQREGLVHLASVVVGGRGAPVCEADITAMLVTDGDQERIGLCLQPQTPTDSDAFVAALQALMAQAQALPLAGLLQQVGALTEHHAISNTLMRTRGNQAACADLLGIEADDLALRLARLGLDCAAFTAH